MIRFENPPVIDLHGKHLNEVDAFCIVLKCQPLSAVDAIYGTATILWKAMILKIAVFDEFP